ncbi:MAG TPA: PDR/VanB family oxidoreductase [Burkholderiaceae bacterium]|nr:PDR/VanB family oxidoreductase [Burkholderiaceae bacterium]
MSNHVQTLRVRVAGKHAIAQDIALFELASDDSSPLPPFHAGAHVDVMLPGGITRQYSLCNAPDGAARYQIAVLKEVSGRGGSRAMHEAVSVGDLLTVSAPRNRFPLDEAAAHSLLLAGGIGITPLLSMAEQLSVLGRNFELHCCARTRERMPFRERIAASPYAARVHLHVDDGVPEQRLHLGVLLGTLRPGTHVYTCGPQGFMEAVLASARSAGWPEAQLHWESFGAAPAQRSDDGGFEVQLARSGRVVPVAASQTVVAALAAHGVEVSTSCEQGVCGTCLTRVLEGEADHRDLYLSPDEQAANDQFLPCCSRSKTARLVLDL